jgi:hypothetical protein
MLMGWPQPNQIKVWFQKFRNGDLFCKDMLRLWRPLLNLEPQLRTFLEQSSFASARVIGQHFLMTISTIRDILQRQLEMKGFSRRWVPHVLSSAQKAARLEASKEMLRILQGSKANEFEGIAMGNESWLRYSYLFPKMFTQSPAEVVPRTRQALGAKKTMITSFLPARKLMVLDVLPKGPKHNQQYFVDYIFTDLKKANLSFHRPMPESTFWVRMDNSLCQYGSKVTSKFGKHHVS